MSLTKLLTEKYSKHSPSTAAYLKLAWVLYNTITTLKATQLAEVL